MKITYIYHSGFAVELDRYVLLFDYYQGNLPTWSGDKTILVFVSHKHRDHFNLKVFDLYGQYKDIQFFFSTDVKCSPAYLERNGIDGRAREKIIYTGKNAVVRWRDVTVETLKSTDQGVAFMVSVEGKEIYHGGDLNWWHWEGEPDSWNRQMEKDYKAQISLIEGRHFDVAFVPLDPRLAEAFGFGMAYFLEHTKADRVFPMHMWEAYDKTEIFKKSEAGRKFASKIQDIVKKEQEFVI